MAGAEYSLFPSCPSLLLRRLEVSLCLSGKRRRKIYLGRVLFKCSGICSFCKGRQYALPLSMEAVVIAAKEIRHTITTPSLCIAFRFL
eukprot:142244-Pelagomonas_calceolata.AAC.3